MKIFYFTATGNSLATAKEFGGELISIPNEINKNTECYEDDVIGLVFPVYGFSLPKIVKNFLKKSKLKANYTFAIGTYGSIPCKVMAQLQELVKAKDYQFDYVDTILTVDNYLPFFDIKKQIENLPNKKIEENTERIKKNIADRVIQKDLKYSLCDNIMDIIAKSINKFVVPNDFAKNFTVNDKCIECGVCTKVCPVKNIKIEDNIIFGKHCESCLACIHACPQNAIHLKNERSSARWLNPKVTLQDIFNSSINV